MSKCDDTSPFFCSSLMPTSQKEIPAALHNLRTVWNRQCLYKKRREKFCFSCLYEVESEF